MNLSNVILNVRKREFSCTLDAGPHMDRILAALKLDPDFGYTLQIEGGFRVVGLDDGATCELDGDAYIVHPTTGQDISFGSLNLDVGPIEEALYEASYGNSDVDQEYSELQYAAAEAAWEAFNER